MSRNLYYKMEIAGIFVTLIAGFLLRFAYAWTDGTAWTVIFASVNGSIWEQVKVFSVPYLVWSVIMLAVARPQFRQFFVAKIAGLNILVYGQLLVYSLLRGVIGRRMTVIEVIVTIAAVVASYIVSSRITCAHDAGAWFVTALFALLLFVASYFCFTYSPPEAGVFIDEETGVHGLPATQEYYRDSAIDALYHLN